MKYTKLWPQFMGVAGLILAVGYGTALSCRRSNQRSEPEPRIEAREELIRVEEIIRTLGKGKKFAEALDAAMTALRRRDLNLTELNSLRIWKGKLLRSLKTPSEEPFKQVLQSPCDSSLRALAYEQIASVREEAGDCTGAISILKELMASCVDDRDRNGGIMDVEANYRHDAAIDISFLYEKLGDGPKAHEWALKSKSFYPFDSFCGNAIQGAHEWLEDRLEHTALLACVSYKREEFSWATWNRRRYGVPKSECAMGIVSGSAMIAMAALVLRRRRRLLQKLRSRP